MIVLHKSYGSLFVGETGHVHLPGDAIKVHDPENLDLEATEEEPARLESGAWRVLCTPECEQAILRSVQYSAPSEKGLPLTSDEELTARAEEKRGNVEIANLARAMHTLVRAGAPA